MKGLFDDKVDLNIQKSFGVENDTLQKAQHKTHKYLEIKDGKYIYDYNKMSAKDHKKAAEHHEERRIHYSDMEDAYETQTERYESRTQGRNEYGRDKVKEHRNFKNYHKEERDKHEKLAKEKGEKKSTLLKDLFNQLEIDKRDRKDIQYVFEERAVPIEEAHRTISKKYGKEKADKIVRYFKQKDLQRRKNNT